MKQSGNEFMRQLLVPLTAGVGLAFFAWELACDLREDQQATVAMWAAVIVMAAGSVCAFYIAYKRWVNIQKQRPASQEEAQAKPQETAAQIPVSRSDISAAAETICRLITGNRDLIRQFKRDRYDDSFMSYLCQFDSVHSYMEEFEEGAEELKELAECTLQLLEQNWKENHKKAPAFDDQLLIAVYFVPAMTRGSGRGAEFCVHFQDAWKRRYPNSVFQLGTYETVSEGFRKKIGLCFITTAVCEADGKPDDCYELQAFRSFRDNWLIHQEGGRELVERYYSVAPGIVALIDMQSDADRIYRGIRENYLTPCLHSIEAGELERCRDTYAAMVQNLIEKFQLP